ncbi:PDZ domain-containing protein [Chryseobacterium carnipullorum]|uniref:PDZ domain-containing protein n=1 Tax=Chryseobacterium carnipullorum TaxID=1124835 RepID=A0A376E8B8_CHRCU|nr:PDZ domain-containing protein [Chryseobacterium carnipullorum]AZA51127.1 PDZ domain-containing protein [Chryseobacterium carnipullorum]AZA65983.1 PDZ domain-containing protein [Chryseobacterium carnipullorum]STD04609.1 Predicted protease with the C-terminal PDZ domain [Chryseobacterium carnipullorum]
MKLKLFLLTIFFSIFIDAQNNFELVNVKKAVIPFKLINNLIFIPINVNGADLTFMLDTGVAETILFSLDNKEIKFENVEKIKFSGLGGNVSIDGFKSDRNLAKIGNKIINSSMLLFIITDEEFNISSHIGIPVNGVIGYHFFKNHPISIDYTAKKITVYENGDILKKKIRKYTEFPLSIEKDKPYLYADIEMTNDKKSSKLLIDLGNSDAIWLFPALIKDFVYNRPNIEDYLGRGFNGDIYGKRSRIHNFYLQDFKFEKPLTAMPDEYSIQHVNLVADRKGSLGGEIMRRFSVIFDYTGGKLYLKKNKNFDDPFHFNMSGLDFKQDGLEWQEDRVKIEPKKLSEAGTEISVTNKFQYKFTLKPIFSVAGVRKDSPAFKAGVKKDDRVLIINGSKTADMTMEKIMDLMKSEEGKNITMVIQRKNKEMTFNFVLEDPIPYQE